MLLADETRTVEFDIAGPDVAQSAHGGEGGPRGAIGWLPLGFQHILEGWDHLLFLLALVLPGGRLGNLVRIVTAFTIAHSLTLAAAALELISVPAAPVEALIALSIAWVAAENLVRVRPMSRRWVIAFAFGLIHGFGFSNVLRDIGLPRDALFSSLMWFNARNRTGAGAGRAAAGPGARLAGPPSGGQIRAPGPVGADPRYQCRVAGAEALSGQPS